jgi:hypothetical protein
LKQPFLPWKVSPSVLFSHCSVSYRFQSEHLRTPRSTGNDYRTILVDSMRVVIEFWFEMKLVCHEFIQFCWQFAILLNVPRNKDWRSDDVVMKSTNCNSTAMIVSYDVWSDQLEHPSRQSPIKSILLFMDVRDGWQFDMRSRPDLFWESHRTSQMMTLFQNDSRFCR